MRARAILSILILAATVATAAAQEPAASRRLEFSLRNRLASEALASEFRLTHGTRVDRPVTLRNGGLRVPTGGFLAATPEVVYGLRVVEPTRLDLALQGAGVATTLGLFAGAVGTTLGIFDENTASWIAGSAAAAGALWGGAVWGRDPEAHLRYEWKP